MLGDMSHSQEQAILALMTKITSIIDLSTLLDVVVQELPAVVGARGCWIYLQPDYVPKYSGLLTRGDTEISEAELDTQFDDFIVLAATNLDSKRELIGKAYFGAGEGITGWVYKNSKPLRIADVTDDHELKSISSDLAWANEYHDGDELYEPGDRRPILAVPLILEEDSIGTLKFHAALEEQSFSEISQEVATIVSHIISGVMRQSWLVDEQNQLISRLIETSNKQAYLDVIADVTGSVKEMLNCSNVEFFLRREDGVELWLAARNGVEIDQSTTYHIKRGEGLIGWVFKTGLPLIIQDLKAFVNQVHLDNELLGKISNGKEVNDEDRFLKYEQYSWYPLTNRLQTVSFIAVPVMSNDQEVEGVLCGYRILSAKIRNPLERNQLILASSFANTIALVLENRRQKITGNLLTELGNISQTDLLFNTVAENIPKLVPSSGCSIFTTLIRHGVIHLKLTHTSRKDLILGDSSLPKIEYEMGEAKTGICGLYQSALVVNHYGKGKASLMRLDREIERIKSEHPNDLTHILLDVLGNKVGLFQMQTEEKFLLIKKAAVNDFAKTIVFHPTGMPSLKLDSYILDESKKTWSFVAVPISSNQKLLGVITLARNIPETPFLAGDVTLLRSIAGRLASVLSNLRIVEQMEQLVMSLAHEINTPLTGVLADSQNLYLEAPANTDLQKIAQHNLEQVQRLHVQTAAIMAVLSEKKTGKQFTQNSIFRPLKEACELFRAEAAQNACDIHGPRARDGEFPVIEMSLFDLTIAFKNIIHNAVKYSFRPAPSMETLRHIRVWGQWNGSGNGYYDVFVQNYGIGISPFEIERRLIFEPYYRGEKAFLRKRTGSGFGLAHARLVIEDIHHGYINATSIHQIGDGYVTTIIVSLPIKQPK
jgi:GAF domain-containing protein